MRDALDSDHWVNGGDCESFHPDAMAMQLLEDENKALRATLEAQAERLEKLTTALKKIKSLVWEPTEATPTRAIYNRTIAKEALE